ncbi:Ankyrin repeat domain-containing protein 13B [Bienertia sinuspersici]
MAASGESQIEFILMVAYPSNPPTVKVEAISFGSSYRLCFESSVIPFISRVAPSDTYKIWKIGANLRADMTLVGFDGFRIQRADQSILFL